MKIGKLEKYLCLTTACSIIKNIGKQTRFKFFSFMKKIKQNKNKGRRGNFLGSTVLRFLASSTRGVGSIHGQG